MERKRFKIEPDLLSSEEDEDLNENYAEQYVKQEMKIYANCMQNAESEIGESGLTIDDIADDLATTDIRSEVYRLARMPEVYRKYNFDVPVTKKPLTINAYKEKILNVIKTNTVVIIDGPTGCGKTTQVPQYILDDCRLSDKECNIVVTQPRKIATINVAKRVCSERGWAMGTVCGYQVGLQKELGQDVILSYMTTGVLLQKLIAAKSLNQYTHIIIDEVHERNQDLDFLLLVVRKLLFTKSFHTKVILMSATIDADEFAYYFRTQYRGSDMPAPIIPIREKNAYGLTIYYLDHLPQVHSPPVFDEYKPEISREILNTFMFLMTAMDKLDEQKELETNEKEFGSVLVFLPGIREIEDIEKLLKDKQNNCNLDKNSHNVKWDIIPLHSSLPNDDQARVFDPVRPPLRKIILSTNIAESSITVPDVTYVVDFCLTKTMVVDEITKFSSLHLEWASHVSCDQRAGRAGRVKSGRVYRLVPKEFYDNHLQKRSVPEMMRSPLEIVVLHTKMLELSEEPKAVLALALSPPNLSNIENTLWHLKETGAMLKTCRGRANISDGDITFLGIVMASLPLDVCLSKLIVLGYMFSVLHDAIIMAAGCSIQNIFATPFIERLEAYDKKLLWADGSCSDLMAMLNLYKVWQAYKRDGAFRKANEEYSWCKKNFVSLKGLREWHLLINEIQARLKRLRIEETAGPSRVNLTIHERVTVLKVVICGAFYPNYFIKSSGPEQIEEREAVRAVGGRDPYKTVFLTGIEPGQPGALYAKDIKNKLDLKENAKIEFDGSSKIYIEFKNYKEPETVTVDGQQYVTTIPGKIAMPVYRAVKRRKLKLEIKLNVLPTHLANEHLAILEKQQRNLNSNSHENDPEKEEENKEINCFTEQEFDPLPSRDTEYITVCISYRIDASHFFCQNIHDNSQQLLTCINRILNTTPLKSVTEEKINLDDYYAALFTGDNQYYRVKIHSRTSKTQVHIIYIDYGNTASINIQKLYELPNDPIMKIAPIAFECMLIEVQPAWDIIRKGIWSDYVNNLFDEKTQNVVLHGKVYSVCDDVVHLELFRSSPRGGREQSINQWLINNNHARKVEESFLSKQDHELRLKVQQSDNPHKEAQSSKNMSRKKEVIEIEPNMRGMEKYMKEITLKGPFSPLEMKIHSVISRGDSKQVDIEPSSVNSVLLDSDPVDSHTRLIVACQVKQSASGNNLNLRQTTLMPNIPGFPFLMAMLFCPQMEPKLNPSTGGVSSLLCGLGLHENSTKPCFAAHDMLLILDTEINEEIVNLINEIRFTMNTLINLMRNVYELDDRFDQIEQYQRSIKTKIFQLLKKKLRKIAPFYNTNLNIWKNHPAGVEILNPPLTEDLLWPLHWFIKVKQVDEKVLEICANLEKMDMMAKKVIPFEDITCLLCRVSYICLMKLRMHLISPSHKLAHENLKSNHNIG
ncbi:probable ATP-dependent RNA helicase spindle-E [Coccinella septempunctata]|uniref:probable ATP-dependent RNA helicase spindle-E n=1 Tax=Coccinella septempunctata TaxID=41139 RepID=UPI001D073FA4|nr:probable ATP-dependent RNA helicase spindle-E [Coccinella septempunctata]